MKHAYIPRTTTYNLNPGEELNDLRMSDEVRPLYEHVKKFIRETVNPMSVEFMRLGEGKKDRWSFTPEQLAVLQKAEKAKEEGLWNFFLPDDETGQGLKNLDYAYIAVELAKNPKSSTGMAKPTPSLPPLIEAMAVLIPMTRPSASASGPPELPGLMGASVWMSPVSVPSGVSSSRSRPEMMPAVTDAW